MFTGGQCEYMFTSSQCEYMFSSTQCDYMFTSSSPGEDIGQDRLPQLPTWVENLNMKCFRSFYNVDDMRR